MKTILVAGLITTAAAFSGCAQTEARLALLKPAAETGAGTNSNSTNGTLVVYSAYRVNADFNARDPFRPEYSDYKILGGDGKLLKRVHNNSGTILQSAVPVPLAPGKYQVVARFNGHGKVTVPVLISANQTTTVRLVGNEVKTAN